MSLRSDAELIRDSADNPELFGEIFSRHFDDVFRFVARRVGADDSADVVSEVFVRAYRGRHRYDQSRPHCLPWLYGIAANVLGDRVRKLRRRPSTYLHVDQPDELQDADDRMVAQSVVDEINEALGRLSRRDRDTFLMFALEDLSYSEIAVALGIPPGTVGSRIARARRALREEMAALGQILDQMEQIEGDSDDA